MSSNFCEDIEECISKYSHKTGVSYYNGLEWTTVKYAELIFFANEISNYLKRCNGHHMSYVLLYLKITATFPILILGVLKAGLGFVCVEEDQEEEYLVDYLSKLRISCILSNIESNKLQHPLVASITLKEKCLVLGEEVTLHFRNTIGTLSNKDAVPCQKFMYAIKTSGTTGLSKIVQVSYDCIVPNIKDLSGILQINCDDTIFLMTPVTFDPSIVEVFLALSNGSSLCILDKAVKQDPQKIVDILFPSAGGIISILQTTPSILKRWNQAILRKHIFHSTSSLRAVLIGGDEFPPLDELMSWDVSPHINVYNIYGITEVSCWATINKVWPSKTLSQEIGTPLSKTLVKIISEPGSDEGELWIGSETRICLVGSESYEDVFKGTEPVFRSTGDIFKNDNGKLYFIGRKDDVLKRLGTRLSLSEVERVTRLHEDVRDCSCVCLKLPDHIKIGLFVVLKVHSKSLQSIKDFLKEKLPKSSWPDKVEAIPYMPLTNHGKVCKETLRKMCIEQKGRPSRQRFNELWDRYTNTNTEGTVDFMSAGGNSFTALQFYNELMNEFVDMSGKSFFYLLLERKTKDELWLFLDTSTSKRFLEENENKPKFTSELKLTPSVDSKTFCGGVSVGKTYLKGKVYCFDQSLEENNERGQEEVNIKRLQLKELFKYNLGKCVDASPLGITFSNKRNVAVVGSHSGDIVVLDVDEMQLISKCTLPDRVESSACISHCGGNIIYIGCYDGCLYSISLHSGKLFWKYQTGDMIKSTAVLHEGDIIFGSYDKYVYRLNKEGNLKWKTQLKSPILAEIIIWDNVLYCAALGSLAAVNFKTGQILWEHSQIPIFSSPVLSKYCLIVADVKGKVQWINLNTAKEEDSFEAGDMVFSSLVMRVVENEELLFFGCQDGYINCLKNRKLFWRTALDSKVVSTPFIHPSLKFLVVFSSLGRAYLLNILNGDKLCEYSLPGEVFSSPIIMENKIIIGCRDDNVYCLQIKS